MSLCNTNLSIKEIDNIFSRAEKIFFIGIGGVSMSAMAEFCALLGKEIYGYDSVRSPVCVGLEKMGKIKYSSTPDNVKGMDLVIYTNAISEHCYEYRQAKRKNIPVISRANFLGYIISLHKRGIGVCGMHGKSTVTSMIGHIFYQGDENPTIFCGAKMSNFDSNFKFGGRACCIFESCEYQNSFLCLPTSDAVVLNIDYDHPDFFESMEQIKSSFKEYISRAKRVFLNCDSEILREFTHRSIVTFGFDKRATYRGEILGTDKNGTTFNIYKNGELLSLCRIPFFGSHVVLDAICAFSVAHTHQIPASKIALALSTFKGVSRRMEFIKKIHTGADIFEDYAHHPTEIKATISSLFLRGYKNILCVFQPHTFSRTHFLYSEFLSAFEGAKKVIVAPTFSAREENIFELSEEKFALDCKGQFINDFQKIVELIYSEELDAVVLMGAGDLSANLKPLI